MPAHDHLNRQAALEDAPCVNCGKRPGRIAWGDALAMTHGWGESRCRRCVYGPQFLHALGRVVALPRLLVLFLYSVVTRS